MSPELKKTLRTLLTHDGKGVNEKYHVLMRLVYDIRDHNLTDGDFSELENQDEKSLPKILDR